MKVGEIDHLIAFGLAGFLVGEASLAALRLNTSLYLGGGLWWPISLHLARLAVVAGALVWMVLQGPGPLISGAAGLVLARPIAMRVFGRVT